jgi:hypothetical protein
MKNKLRVISIVLVIMLLGTMSVFAANGDIYNLDGTKEYDARQVQVTKSIKNMLRFNKDKYAYEIDGKAYLLEDAFTAFERFGGDRDLMYAQMAEYFEPVIDDVTEPPEEGDLEVIEISAIDSTTIRVLFSNGIESNFTVDPLKNGSNTVTFIYDGVEYTGTVNWVAKAAVEKVEFDNYRQIRVTFNTVVDESTATNPENYYFEIVEGDVADDVFGVAPTLQDANHLLKMETGYPGGAAAWFADGPHIFENTVNGKTEVTIQLPEDARFTNILDDHNAASAGTLVGTLDDERTLSVLLADGLTLKHLIKNTNVVVSVRNVRNADKIRNIDTSRHEILILDEEKPEIEVMNRVRGTEVTAFTNEVTLLSDGSTL